MISYIDREKRFRFTNKAYQKTFRLSADQIRGRPVRDVLGDTAYRVAEPHIDRALSGQRVQFENVIRSGGGNERHISVCYVPDGDESSTVQGLFALVVDETERKKGEAAGQDSEGRLRALVDTAVDGVILINALGVVQMFNPACEKLFGYRKEEVVGGNVKMLMPQQFSEEHDGYLTNYRRTGERKVIGIGREVVARRRNGSTFPMELSVGEARQEGKPIFVGIIRDITERKLAEEARAQLQSQLLQTQKIEALGNLAGGIAHDFNNILFPIIGLTELAAANLPEGSREHRNISKVIEAAYHARELVRQILAFSRRDPPDRGPVEILKVVGEAVSLLRSSLPVTIELRERFDGVSGLVLADPTQIQQVIVNLGTNARDAMGENGGRLSVELSLVETGFGEDHLPGALKPGP